MEGLAASRRRNGHGTRHRRNSRLAGLRADCAYVPHGWSRERCAPFILRLSPDLLAEPCIMSVWHSFIVLPPSLSRHGDIARWARHFLCTCRLWSHSACCVALSACGPCVCCWACAFFGATPEFVQIRVFERCSPRSELGVWGFVVPESWRSPHASAGARECNPSRGSEVGACLVAGSAACQSSRMLGAQERHHSSRSARCLLSHLTSWLQSWIGGHASAQHRISACTTRGQQHYASLQGAHRTAQANRMHAT